MFLFNEKDVLRPVRSKAANNRTRELQVAPKGASTIDGIRSSRNSRRTRPSVGICGAVWIHRWPIHGVGRELVYSRSGRSIFHSRPGGVPIGRWTGRRQASWDLNICSFAPWNVMNYLLCLCSSFPSLFVCSFVSWVVFFCRAAGFSDRGVKHNLLLGVGGGSWGVLQEVLTFDSFGTLL